MGFRSTFVSEDCSIIWPQWFIDKYEASINFFDGNGCPISSKYECKLYGHWASLLEDIRQAIHDVERWREPYTEFVLVFLHECGGITRVAVTEYGILQTIPDSYTTLNNEISGCGHWFCYGCSDPKELQ